MGRGQGLTTQASLGGAAAGKTLGAHSEQPINPGDLQEAGRLPAEVPGLRARKEWRTAGSPRRWGPVPLTLS